MTRRTPLRAFAPALVPALLVGVSCLSGASCASSQGTVEPDDTGDDTSSQNPSTGTGADEDGATGDRGASDDGAAAAPGSDASPEPNADSGSAAGRDAQAKDEAGAPGTGNDASTPAGHDAGTDAGHPAPAACTWSGALGYSGTASFTCYYFGQGTTPSGNEYKTACGYLGIETTGGSGNSCGQSASDTVDNIASTGLAKATYFAAIPGDSNGGFSNVAHCGECEKLTNPSNGNSVIVTIIDECPISGNQNTPCTNAGHLDVSMQAFNALNFSSGDPSNTTWKSVPCPVSGNIQATLNASIATQVYFQNMVYPIKSVSNATQSAYGYWQFNSGGAGGQATLTDVEGHTVTATIPNGGGDTKVQFPSPGTCP